MTEHPPTDLERLTPDAPPELLAIVRKAMARPPENRYRDARALIEDLQRFLGGRIVDAHQYRMRDVILRWARRHRKVLAVVGLALVVLVAVVVYGVLRISDAWDQVVRSEARATDQQGAAEEARDVAERKAIEVSESLATRWEEVGRKELLESRRPLDAIEPLERALELAPNRDHLYTMLAQAVRPQRALRCEALVSRADAVVLHPVLPLAMVGGGGSRYELWNTTDCTRERDVTLIERISDLRFSSDGSEIQVTTWGPPIRIKYDFTTLTELERTSIPGAAHSSSPVDEPALAWCGRTPRAGEARMWRHELHPSGVRVGLDRRGDIRVWSAVSGACIGAVSERRVSKWRVVATSAGLYLLTLDGDARVSLWQVRDNSELVHVSTLNLDDGGVFDFDVKEMGSTLVTLGRERRLRSWDILAMMDPPLLRASLIALHPNGGEVMVADGATVRRIELSRGEMLSSWAIPELQTIRWTADKRLLARRGTELLDWGLADAAPMTLEVGQIFAAKNLEHEVFPELGLVVVSGALVGYGDSSPSPHDIRVYDRRDGSWRAFDVSYNVRWSARSPVSVDGSRMLLGNTGILLDTRSLSVLAEFDESAVFTADGSEILSFSKHTRGLDRSDAHTGQYLGSVDSFAAKPSRRRGLGDVHKLAIRSRIDYQAVSFDADGAVFAALGPGVNVTLWSTGSRARIAVLEGHRLPTVRALWAPGGTRILTFGRDEVAKLWDRNTGSMLAEVYDVWLGARAVFSQAGPRMAIQEGADRVMIVDTVSGAKLFGVMTEGLADMAFTPDGRALVIVEAPARQEMTLRTIEIAGALAEDG